MGDEKALDLEDALERVGNDSELLIELFDMFLEDCDSNLAKMKEAIATNSQEVIERTAHSMKSAVGNLGAKSSHAAAYALECAGREGDSARYQELLDSFAAEINNFKAAFEEYRSQAK